MSRKIHSLYKPQCHLAWNAIGKIDGNGLKFAMYQHLVTCSNCVKAQLQWDSVNK